MLEFLGHRFKASDWHGDDEKGLFRATCRDPACGQEFELRRGVKSGHEYWTTTNKEHSFSFLSQEEYLVIKNEVLLTVHEQMFCVQNCSGTRMIG